MTRNMLIVFVLAVSMIGFGVEGVITGDVFAFGAKSTPGATLDRERHTVGFWSFVIFYFAFGAFLLWGVIKNAKSASEDDQR